jgi:TonB family protein
MIPRTLVPRDVRPVLPDEIRKPPRRTTTYMDDRTVVPSELSDAPPLDGKTNIPAHLPLDVLINRTLVERGMPVKPFENARPESNPVSIAVLDERFVVPAYVEPAAPEEMRHFERPPQMTEELRQIVEPDIFITGDANLLIEPEEKRSVKSDAAVRTVSLIFHIGLVILIIFLPKIFPAHVPTQEEIELARKELSFVYVPPEGPPTPRPPVPKIHIDSKTLNRIAPPRIEAPLPAPAPQPAPAPPEPKNLPEAPKPQVQPPIAVPSQPTATAPSQLEPIQPVKPNPNSRINLGLSNASPSKLLHDEMEQAARQGGPRVYIPPSGGVPRGMGGGGQGPGMQPGVSILTPTQGVDFNPYLQRVLAAVKRNWFAVMPESAWMGDRGIVVLTFKITSDGVVPVGDPILERTSGKQPLDNAAMSAIRASSPFEPLPSEFKGPSIQLRFIFFYNIPPNLAE